MNAFQSLSYGGLTAVVIGALVASIVSPTLLKPWLIHRGVIDAPNERSSHQDLAVRGGGLATLLGWGVGIITGMVLFPEYLPELAIVGGISASVSVLGLVDDFRGLSARVRLVAQLLLGLLGATLVCLVSEINLGWAIVGAIIFAGFVNSANFMDGINGMSGVQGAVIGGIFAVVGVLTEMRMLVILGAVIAVIFAAFVPWNFGRPAFFLGDVGSYLLGGSVIMTIIVAAAHGVSVLLLVAPVAVYLADTGVTVVRRFIQGHGVFKAHRTHTYQRLTDTGLSHAQVSVIAGLFTLANAGLAVAQHVLEFSAWLGWAGIVFVCAVYLALPRLRSPHLRSTARRVSAELPAPSVARVNFAPQRWVVFGATGFVGQGIVGALRNMDAEVVGLTAPRLVLPLEVKEGAGVWAAASREPVLESLIEQLSGVDVVINAAGMAAPGGQATPELFGANALLPAVLAIAAERAGAQRFIHVSSAAVQGRRPILDETAAVAPFSPYSRSKALGESALLEGITLAVTSPDCDVVILRATSVQGHGRPTTRALTRVARSRVASVASPGTQPSVVSTLSGLCESVLIAGRSQESVPAVILQPWAGHSVSEVLMLAADGKRPRVLPRSLCRLVLKTGFALGRIAPNVLGLCRRLEMLWFGQAQAKGWIATNYRVSRSSFSDVFGDEGLAELNADIGEAGARG